METSQPLHTEHSLTHAIQGASSILQVSSQSCLAPSAVIYLTQQSPTPMVIHQELVQLSPASVAVSQGTTSPRFIKATRGCRKQAKGSDVGSNLDHITNASVTAPQPDM
ncbi:hypothetical protein FH972_015366 [Carpinus fangiana]|uniref:Uncharacterized protein n=1 Tax=Carpinus fangiana TaxID=176857 RepID=A0A5N6REE2_9ROSI|nr:hypothetical protein FH972_015366 [Carpinus fangiana]